MNERPIAHLEAQLERLVEGTFAQLFGRRLHLQDLALALARAMEEGRRPPDPGDTRPQAPTRYDVTVDGAAATRLLPQQAAIGEALARYITSLATEAGYSLASPPQVYVHAVAGARLQVAAQHASRPTAPTHALAQPVVVPPPEDAPHNPQLLLGTRVLPLGGAVVNIGRDLDNDVILDDPQVSRRHAQLRLRFGQYTLFDAQSTLGTFVNDVRIREHALATGDVLRLGNTRLVYLEDEPGSLTETRALPVAPDDDPSAP